MMKHLGTALLVALTLASCKTTAPTSSPEDTRVNVTPGPGGDNTVLEQFSCVRKEVQAWLKESKFEDIKITVVRKCLVWGCHTFEAEDSAGNQFTGETYMRINTEYDERTGNPVAITCHFGGDCKRETLLKNRRGTVIVTTDFCKSP